MYQYVLGSTWPGSGVGGGTLLVLKTYVQWASQMRRKTLQAGYVTANDDGQCVQDTIATHWGAGRMELRRETRIEGKGFGGGRSQSIPQLENINYES